MFFAEIVGKPCWNAQPGYGSAFMMQFGAPHLETREPITSNSESEKVRKSLARRHISIKGDWSRLVEFCGWRLLQQGVLVVDSDSFSDIDHPTVWALQQALDGQKLLRASGDGAMGTSRFEFEMGGMLETFPWKEIALGEWIFFTPDHHTLSYRTDGHYSWSSGDAAANWQQLPR